MRIIPIKVRQVLSVSGMRMVRSFSSTSLPPLPASMTFGVQTDVGFVEGVSAGLNDLASRKPFVLASKSMTPHGK